MKIQGVLASLTIGLAIAVAPHAASAQEIVIGAILPLTGPAAPIGIEEQQGVQFTVDRLNAKGGVRGRKIKVLFEDSQGKPDQGVLGFNRLVDLNSIPVTLTAYSSISLAIAPLATRRKVLVINPAAQTNKLETASPYLINTIPLVKDEIAHLAGFAFKNVGKSAAIIYENAAAGIDSRDDFKKFFEAAGGKILADEAVEFGQTNYRSTLLKVVSVKPELVFIAVTQSHAAFAEQVGQTPGLPGRDRQHVLAPVLRLPGDRAAGITPRSCPASRRSDEKEFNAKFGTKEMGFFAREYANSTDIIVQAHRPRARRGQAAHRRHHQARDLRHQDVQVEHRRDHLHVEHRGASGRDLPARRQRARAGEVRPEDVTDAAAATARRRAGRRVRRRHGGDDVRLRLRDHRRVPRGACRASIRSAAMRRGSRREKGIPFLPALAIGVLAGALGGALIQIPLYDRLARRNASPLVVLIASLGALAIAAEPDRACVHLQHPAVLQ